MLDVIFDPAHLSLSSNIHYHIPCWILFLKWAFYLSSFNTAYLKLLGVNIFFLYPEKILFLNYNVYLMFKKKLWLTQ